MVIIKLEWKEFNLNLAAVETWLRANAGEHYTGNQASSGLELIFTEEPSQEVLDDIGAYWELLTEESDEATSYLSRDDVAAARAAKKASGLEKLIGLGLTEEEANAIVG